MKQNEMPQNQVFCKNMKEWHDWLSSHHEKESQVWLQIQKADFIGNGVYLKEAVEEAICFGWIDGVMHSLDSDSYLLRFTPRRPGSRWSLINRKRAEALIATNRMTKAGLAAIQEAQRNGQWQAAYSSKEKPEIPPDLLAALEADPEANSQFATWTNSVRFQLADWVLQSKKKETRDTRIKKIVRSAHEKRRVF